MRKDHFSAPAKWTREFRTAIKLSHAHHSVYSYLENALESHATGIYFVTLSAIAEMVNDDRDVVAAIMADLDRIGLIHWDPIADVVYVPCVCSEQFRWKGQAPKESDFRIVEAKRHIEALPSSSLVELFISRWPVFKPTEGAYQGATQAPYKAPYQGAYQAPTQAPPTYTTTSPSPSPRGAEHAQATPENEQDDGLDTSDAIPEGLL